MGPAHASSYQPPLPSGAAPTRSHEEHLAEELQAALLAGKDTTLLREALARVRAQRAAAIAHQGAAELATWRAMTANVEAAGAKRAAETRDALARQVAALQPSPFPLNAG
jgi:hypothetical protein